MEYALTNLYLCPHSEGKQLEHLRAAETSLIHILGAESRHETIPLSKTHLIANLLP
jgi:hypothetical protein